MTYYFNTLLLLMLLTSSVTIAQSDKHNNTKMKVAIWDTYVPKKDGSTMHFDIVAPENVRDTNLIYSYGKSYLARKNQAGQPLSSKECRFCHIETLRPQWVEEIEKNGFFIIEMENCE